MPSPSDQRVRTRVRLDLPARIRQIGPPRDLAEEVHTLDVSRNGLLFRTHERYDLGSVVWVMMPYNAKAIAPNPEFPARVVRIDRKPDGLAEVAVQFHSGRADQFKAAPPPPPAVQRSNQDRRNRSRVRMSLPIRVRHESAAEESVTVDVSRAGVLFQTARQYPVGQTVWVLMPYQAGAQSEEVAARVVRMVERGDVRGVALHFASAASGVSYARPF
jgi:Tfp pilus assembly protein PilZ